MRLIDADALSNNITVLFEKNKALIDEWLMYHIEDEITDAPTIDAEPVRHGWWIFEPKDAIEMMHTKPKCSECGYESADGLHYCSNCGAKMDSNDSNDSNALNALEMNEVNNEVN